MKSNITTAKVQLQSYEVILSIIIESFPIGISITLIAELKKTNCTKTITEHFFHQNVSWIIAKYN